METRRNDSSFTLIEILVALSMILIILGVVYGSYTATMQSLSRCRAKIGLEQEARTLLSRMAQEIRCGYPSAVRREPRPPSTHSRPATKILREADRPHFLGERASPRGDLLQLLTAGGITRPDEALAGLSLVAYRFDESRRTLLRRQVRLVDLPDIAANDDNWLPAARRVRAVVLKYFDGKEWREEWNSNDTRRLPEAVSIQITMDDERAAGPVFATVAPIAWPSASATVTIETSASDGKGIASETATQTK